MYLYTVNAFPYGAFKGTIVKEQVYEPDWRAKSARITPSTSPTCWPMSARAGMAPSIQSAPLGFKPRVTGGDVVASYTEHVLRVVAHLVAIEARTGRTVQLALEPEPLCFLETTDETIDYFTRAPLFGRRGGETRQARAHADCGGERRAAPASRHGVRHLPSGGRNSRTSPRRCKSWWTPAFRSSSCRKPRRCICRK